MKGWVGLFGWPIADGLPTLVVTHQLQVERRTGKVRRPETDVLALCHATDSSWLYVREFRRGARVCAGCVSTAARFALSTHQHTGLRDRQWTWYCHTEHAQFSFCHRQNVGVPQYSSTSEYSTPKITRVMFGYSSTRLIPLPVGNFNFLFQFSKLVSNC